MAEVVLATEDELSEVVGCRLLSETEGMLKVSLTLRRNGSGYLRNRIQAFQQMARRQPVILITDLDRVECPESLRRSWLGGHAMSRNLLFRVAVREVEAWLLADHIATSALLGAASRRFPHDPDQVPDPKAALLSLAARAPRIIRDELVARKGVIASQGPGYNAVLGEFVRTQWNPTRAASRSESLRRARMRIAEFAAGLK